jgi:LPXTG-motif cell wall-anchored protein
VTYHVSTGPRSVGSAYSAAEYSAVATSYSAYSAAYVPPVSCPVDSHWDAVVQTCLPDKITWNTCQPGQVYVEGKGCTSPEAQPACGPGMVMVDGKCAYFSATISHTPAGPAAAETPKTIETQTPSSDTPTEKTSTPITSSDTPKVVSEKPSADVPTQVKMPAVVKTGETGGSSSSTTWIVGGVAVLAAVGIYFATRKR